MFSVATYLFVRICLLKIHLIWLWLPYFWGPKIVQNTIFDYLWSDSDCQNLPKKHSSVNFSHYFSARAAVFLRTKNSPKYYFGLFACQPLVGITFECFCQIFNRRVAKTPPSFLARKKHKVVIGGWPHRSVSTYSVSTAHIQLAQFM